MPGGRRQRWLRHLLAAGIVACVLAPAARAEPLRFGLNAVYLRAGETPDALLDFQAQLGATVQRSVIPWRSVQPEPGRWDWNHVDVVVGRAQAHGMETIAVVNGVPPWAQLGTPRQCLFDRWTSRCQPPPRPENIGDFQTFVRELAARYPSLAAIEVFNEPNLGVYNWQPQADPEYYAYVLRAANQAVDQVRPSLPVLSGGVGPPGEPVPEGSMGPGQFLERMYAAVGRGAMDGIALHPYPARSSPENPSSSVHHIVMGEARAIRDRNGDEGLPIWITEVGYTTTGHFSVTPQEQARWLPMIVGEALAAPDVESVVVHTLRDNYGNSDSPDTGYGLLYADHTPKPVFDALAATVRELQGQVAQAPALASKRASGRLRRCTRRSCCRRGSTSRRCPPRRATPQGQLATTRE